MKDYFLSAGMALFVSAASGLYLANHSRNANEEQGRKKLSLYNRNISAYLGLRKVNQALDRHSFRNVVLDSGMFIDEFTDCILFYSDRHKDYSDFYGACSSYEGIIPDSVGWSVYRDHLVLLKNAGKSGLIVFFRDNPDNFLIHPKTHEPYLTLKRSDFASAVPGSLLIGSFFIVCLCIASRLRQSRFNKLELEQKRARLHDSGQANVCLSVWGRKLRKNPSDSDFIAEGMLRAAELNSMCTSNEKPLSRPTKVKEIVQTLITGYAFLQGIHPSVLASQGSISDSVINIPPHCLIRALKNLLENAFIGSGRRQVYIHAEKSDNFVEFLIRNPGTISSPEKIFKDGYSTRSSTGQGMGIIIKSLNSCGTYPQFTQEEGYVVFRFKISIM